MPPETITCRACGYAKNEPERVYCHECGEKLDRRKVPRREVTSKAEQRRLRRLIHPRVPFLLPLLGGIGKTVLISLSVSLLLLILIPPPHPLPPTEEERFDPPRLSIELERALMTDRPIRITVEERSINTYFDAHIRSRDTSVLGISLRFDRAFVHLEPGICHISMVRKIGGLPLYTRAAYALEINARGLQVERRGGGIGRLAFAPFLMPLLDGSFAQLWKTLDSERKLVQRLQSIEIEEGRIVMVSRPNAL